MTRFYVAVNIIWDNFTITREDIREDHDETRWVTFGFVRGEVVVLVFTERDGDDHYISFREAELYEATYYIETAKKHLR